MFYKNHPKRIIQLDFLRGIAILLVLGRHSPIQVREAGDLWRIPYIWGKIGWVGVDFFFVLSGYLIGGILMSELRRTSTLDVRRFLVRRGFKIWPAYFAFVAFCFVDLAFHEGGTWRSAFFDILPNLLHVQNYVPTSAVHTWSLSVEEHFYLFLPFFLLVFANRWKTAAGTYPIIPITALALWPICLGFRIFNWEHFQPFNYYTHVFQTHLRMDGLFAGVLLAYLKEFHPAGFQRVANQRILLVIVGCVAFIPILRNTLGYHPYVNTYGFLLTMLTGACMVTFCAGLDTTRGFFGREFASAPCRLVAGIGYFSYGIYIWHIHAARHPVQYILERTERFPDVAELHWLLVMLVYVTLAVLAGALSTKIIEEPLLKLRDRLFPRNRAAGPPR